jgi:predicted nuclease with TOPRIM domain
MMEERIDVLEKEVADLKQQLEKRPDDDLDLEKKYQVCFIAAALIVNGFAIDSHDINAMLP